jgi:hypothetical protein
MAVSVNLSSQPYTFTAVQGAFTQLTGGTNVSSIQTVAKTSAAIDIGFTFYFNGKPYTQLKASSGGFITFKVDADWGVNTLADSSIIGPLGYTALNGDVGTVTYKTEGTAPNRIFTMEWLNWKWDWNATAAGISFQAKLYETSNRIEFVYREEAGALNEPYAQVGLFFQYPGKFMILTNSSASPEASTIHAGYINTRPATGQIYRFDMKKDGEPTSHLTNFATINQQSVRLKWTDAIGATKPSRYLIKVSSLGYDNITTPEDGIEYSQDLDLKDGSGLAYVDMGKQSYTSWADSAGNTTYYMKIFPLTNSFTYIDYKTDGDVPQLQVKTPYYQARKLSFSNFTTSSMVVNWIRGTGNKCVVFAKEKGSGAAIPEDNVSYTGNSVFQSGTQIGTSGWYCIYDGTGNSIEVTGLKGYTSYAFHVIEYSGDPGAEIYSKVDEPTAHLVQTNSLLTSLTNPFPGVYCNDLTWGDYDNDNDLDLLFCGQELTKIYKNNGNNSFSELAVTLPGLKFASAAWGDYDNDNDLDILITGQYGSVGQTKIFRNNGNSTFTDQTSIQLAKVYNGSVSWGDYNNDGKLDILLTGNSGAGYVTKIYRNIGNNSFFEQSNISIPGVYSSSVVWGDYDNDADLDILIAGNTGSGIITKVFRNEGDNSFKEQTGISLKGIFNGIVLWKDYNNDGFLDILVTGENTGFNTKLYRNNGNNTYTEVSTSLAQIYDSAGAMGDFDNDGDLDLYLTGWSAGIKFYQNNPVGTFTELRNIPVTNQYGGDAAWGDIDNDGDLDLVFAGYSNGYIPMLYRNDILVPNVAPVSPQSLVTNIVSGKVEFKWKHVRNDATPEKTMTYNVRVGNTSNGSEIVSPMSNVSTGYRKVVENGNAGHDTTFTLYNLKKGTYYWSVQAVDQSYTGGAFAGEQSFTYNYDYPSTGLSFISNNENTVKCYWQRGNGEKCVVFVKEKGTGIATTENNTNYIGSKAYGSGSQIGTTGWYCVYNGDKDTATIYNLKSNTEYRFQVIEYTGNAGSEVYYTTTGDGNPAQYRPLFSEQAQITLTGVSGNTNAWGDYDNDGDLDIILGGNNGTSQVVELYKNNGDNTFTKSPATFSVNTVYDIQWGDYDNDDDLDLLILSSFNSKVFENKGNGTFTAKANLADVFSGKGQWADFDNDGFKDIIFTGMGGTKIYKNNHDGTFAIQTHVLPTVSNYSAVACDDYDNDGDLDVLLSGLSGSTAITKVFKNNGNFSFTEQTSITNLPGISNCAVKWADMDNDGDLDIIMSGADYNFATKIFDNAGNNTFTEISGPPFKELYRSSLAIADYDNDGYRDLIVSGSYNGEDYYTILYRNNGNKTYSEVKTITFPGIQYGSLNWGDYDNDNDLDLFLCGTTSTGKISKIFRNNGSVFNTRPEDISSLSSILDGNDVKITWYRGADTQTTSKGLSYNLYIYESSKSQYAKSGEAFPYDNTMNGRKLTASFGDIQYSSNGYIIKGLSFGDYKVSIQAVDAGLLGGKFYERSLSIYDLSGVAINVADSKILNTKSGTQYSINSTDGVDGTWYICNDNYTNLNFRTGGFDLWVRQTDNKKNKKKVATIGPQAAAPAFTINYQAETIAENMPSNIEYSFSYYMSAPVTGNDNHLEVSPGKTMYIRYKATAASVASLVQTLGVGVRPSKPDITIDYIAEKTAQLILTTMEYASSIEMNNVISGTGDATVVTPGEALYFRNKATSTSFSSFIREVEVTSRPQAPSNLVVNDLANTLDWTYNPSFTSFSDYEYSLDGGSTWTVCVSKPVKVGNINIDAGNAKIRIKAIPFRFKSLEASSTSAFTITNSTVVKELEEAGIRMFPVPVNDILFLENLPESSYITIFNLSGKLVYQLQTEDCNVKIPVNEMPQGMYLIKIKTAKGEFQSKFSKQ